MRHDADGTAPLRPVRGLTIFGRFAPFPANALGARAALWGHECLLSALSRADARGVISTKASFPIFTPWRS